MSFDMMKRVFDLDIPSTDKLVLIAIADHAEDETGYCYPSIKTIAKKCSLSERAVQYAVRSLTANGYLKHDKGPDGWFWIVFPEGGATDAPTENVGVQQMHRGGAPNAPKPIIRTYQDIPLFVADATNKGDPPIERLPDPDPDRAFWDAAKGYLASYSKNPGALIGKWLREHGKEQTAQAITSAQIEHAVDPVAYIGGYFRRHGNSFQPTVPL